MIHKFKGLIWGKAGILLRSKLYFAQLYNIILLLLVIILFKNKVQKYLRSGASPSLLWTSSTIGCFTSSCSSSLWSSPSTWLWTWTPSTPVAPTTITWGCWCWGGCRCCNRNLASLQNPEAITVCMPVTITTLFTVIWNGDYYIF